MKLDRTNKMLTGLGIVAAILIVKLFIIQVVDDKYKSTHPTTLWYIPRYTPHEESSTTATGKSL